MKRFVFRSTDEYIHLDADTPEASATNNDVVAFSTAIDLYRDAAGNVVASIDALPRDEQRRIEVGWKRRFEPLPIEVDIVRDTPR